MVAESWATRALRVEDVPVAPIVYDDSDVACRRGPLGEVRYVPEEVPHEPESLASLFVREDGSAYSYQRQDILVRSAFFARLLSRDCKVDRGDAVFFADASLARRTEWVLACHRLGAVPIMAGPSVPITFLHHPERMHIKAVLVESRQRAEQISTLIKDGPEQSKDEDSAILHARPDLLGYPRGKKPCILVAAETWEPDLAFQAEVIQVNGRTESHALWLPVWPENRDMQRIASMKEVSDALQR